MPRPRSWLTTAQELGLVPSSPASSPRPSTSSPAWPPAAESFALAGVSYQLRPIRCGKPTCAKWHGPYWYAFWWADGKTRSKYIGKRLPADLQAARDGTAAPALVTPAPRDPSDPPTG